MASRSLYLAGAFLAALAAIFFSRNSTDNVASTPRLFPGRNNTVLVLSDAHPGMSNVHVATSHAMLLEYPDLDIHYASFPKMEKIISTASDFAVNQNPATKPMRFHSLAGKTYVESLHDTGYNVGNSIQLSGLKGLAVLCNNMQDYLMPWTAPNYLAIYRDILRVLDEVDPIVIVVDPIFGPALDAIRAQGRNHVILSPNSLKDNFVSMQPWGSMFWKYPAYKNTSAQLFHGTS